LFLISAGGPGSLSFNEFNPIFNRNGATAQFSTLAGENDTIAGEIVLSAIQNRLSWSLGYTKFRTDGWRENADQDDDIANAFLQYELSYKTSIQAEYRYRDTERGDLQMSFFEDDFFPNLRIDDKTQSFRLGFRHGFSPGSDLIGNFQYQDFDGDLEDEFFPGILDSINIDTDADAYGGELQYLFRSNYLNLVTGAGYFDIDSQQTFSFSIVFEPFPGFPTITITDKVTLDATHGNAYLYSYIKPLDNLTFTVGASYDDFDPDDEDLQKDRDQFNPKFGVIWNPIQSTTLRGAVFRTLKRPLISDQTLEPTQVAGFNQFFGDPDGTESWRYGGAVDQKFSENIYGGVEFSCRDLRVPFSDFVAGVVDKAQWEEKIFRGYLYWTAHEWLALSAEYQYERFDRDREFAIGIRKIRTHSVPLGMNFFHPSGLSASLTGTYIDQQGSFERATDVGIFENGDDDFFLVDAAISYRLPKRFGFITVGARNLFDNSFKYYDTDRDYDFRGLEPRDNVDLPDTVGAPFVRSPIRPDRLVFLTFTLAF
jgi:hypothetical protein